MFHAIRDWWMGGRGKLTARLFAFEFSVVVVGVLVAQGLANYVQHRSNLARMEAERSRIRWELVDAHSGFHVWRAAIPCLDQRLAEVMQGKAFSASALHRPTLISIDVATPSTDTIELIARRYGEREKIYLNWILGNIDNVKRATSIVREAWGRILLIDPVNGPMSAGDRAEARRAAADIRAQLRFINSLAEDVEPLFKSLGIGARDLYTPDRGPARSCAAIWKTGQINPPLTTR